MCNGSGTPAGLEPLPVHVTITATNAWLCKTLVLKSAEVLGGGSRRNNYMELLRGHSGGAGIAQSVYRRAACWTTGVRFPEGASDFFTTPQRPDRLWGPPDPLYNGYRCGQRGRSMKLTTFWCQGQGWWSYISTPQHVLMACCLIY
jgi:hypothetical protein